MLRFAHNPVRDMNVGDLRIALINYIVSQQQKEDLIIRIEDTNQEKDIDIKDNETLDILALFGIKYSQVIHQSQNVRFHTAMAIQLLHEKKAFSCFCSSSWIEKQKAKAKSSKKMYLYDDACKNLPAELVIDNENPFTIRIIKPNKPIIINDKIKGNISSHPETMDSFMIMTQEKTPTYNFSCAIDDMLNDISIVIKDKNTLNDTFKEEHIRKSLNYDKNIEYAHISNITNDNLPSIKYLLEEGYLPDAISNYLISIDYNKIPTKLFNTQECIDWFELCKLSENPILFDIETLKHINKEHLKILDAKELSRYVGFADEDIGELARIYLEEANTTKELKSKIKPIFAKKEIPNELLPQITIIKDIIKNMQYFENYNDFKNYILEKSKLGEQIFAKCLRILLTNTENGPNIEEIYKYLKNYIGEITK